MNRRHAQRGVAAVEFAIGSLFFFTLLLGIVEMGRLLWTWNAAVEATRIGARIAIVCDRSGSATLIYKYMATRLPSLTSSNVTVTYLNPPAADNSCDDGNCKAVNVRITNYTHATVIPFVPLTLTLPTFSTTQRKEYMQTAGNSVCVAPT